MSDKNSHKWTVEQEGEVAQLLSKLSRAESDEERTPFLEELRKLTRLDYGSNVGKWLGWYLEEHLGMRNVIGILSGKTAPEYEGSESAQLMEENVFDRAEYNWCALERINNKDDMYKLRCLYSDLEGAIHTEHEGAFSFQRLTGVDAEDLSYFTGKSVSEAIFDENVQVRHLRVLKDYGKMMMMPLFPSSTQRAGAIIYAASISQALVRHDTKITSLSYQDLAESLPGLLERPYVVERYQTLFRGALEKCK